EVIRKDERTGLTYFFSFEELTPADIKYTRVPRYNPAQLFPNIALDLSRARAGDAVPVVNYTRNMIVSDGCRALRPDSDNTPRATFNPLDGGRVL
ncbi:MAG: hypothetical protein NZ693_05900, partial [Thermoflexales bacterium]|nr:hypothetical protein [Thermoflexales bacterium]